MSNTEKHSRRQFLRNISLSALALGIPSLIKAKVDSSKTLGLCDKVTEDAFGQGPFYTPNAPLIQNDKLASPTEVGQKMIISGRVYNLDCSEEIANTEIDIWHANDNGDYDNSGFNLRGIAKTNIHGFYIFETIKPGHYLNGATFRPAHIHFKITPPGFSPLITQLYFAGDQYIAGDFAASQTSGTFDATHRIIPLSTNSNGVLEGTWDIVINGNGTPVGVKDLHLDKGVLYNVSPNPFTDFIDIKYGVFAKSKVKIMVVDILGNTVAKIDEQHLDAEKYEVRWQPNGDLPSGHYFIILTINDLQVHYLKVLKK